MPRSLAQKLSADLTAAGFTVSALTELWGEDAEQALHRNHRVPALRRLKTQESTPASTLATLFVLGMPVGRSELHDALPTLGVDGAEELGLIDASRDSIRPSRDLRPYSFMDATGAGSWWIVSDLGELALGRELGEDHVLGVGGASLSLAGLMLQKPVQSVLDLGTGCGIQAMHASRHAQRVVATDISERALEMARLNAELNGIDNIEFRRGSLFEPVEGELFDQIVSNPPFVITPRRADVPAYEYRDGGLVGDAIVREVVTRSAAHLTPDGTVQMLANWEYSTTTSGLDRVASWVRGATEGALDSWVIEREVQTPEEYAETWIRDGGTRPGSPEYDALSDAWLDDFDRRGVRAVGFGYVILRLRSDSSGSSWNRYERLQTPAGQNETGLGVHIEQCMSAADRVRSMTDAELAMCGLTVSSDVTEERHFWPGAEDPTAMILRQGGGFGRTRPVDTALSALVGACDGELPLGAIVGALAQLLQVDEDALASQLVPQVRELVDDGILLLP